jgi:hypothetical protein
MVSVDLHEGLKAEFERVDARMAARSMPRSAGELVSATIESVPTIFGRIVLLASMLNRQSGRYLHPLPVPALQDAAASELLRETHERLLICWLDTTLEYQVDDLVRFLRGCGEKCPMVASDLLRREKYSDLLPLKTPETSQKHFLMQIEWVLPLGVNQISGAAALLRQPGIPLVAPKVSTAPYRRLLGWAAALNPMPLHRVSR